MEILPTDLLDLSKPKIFEIKPWEKQNLEVTIFELTRTILTTIKLLAIFGQNLAIYTVSYKEFESEVKKYQILEPGGKNQEKLT